MKTLFLSATIALASVAVSSAQVYSGHAVGYVNTTIPPKSLALISNPLLAVDNSIAGLFTDPAQLAGGLSVYKLTPGLTPAWTVFSFDPDFQDWDSAGAYTETVMPGDGVFVRNPTGHPVTITFAGEIEQGDLHNPIPQGLSIKSSMVPQEGIPTVLGYVPTGADILYTFDTVHQQYDVFHYDTEIGQFDPPLKKLHVGEAFLIWSVNGGDWSRTFFVNQ